MHNLFLQVHRCPSPNGKRAKPESTRGCDRLSRSGILFRTTNAIARIEKLKQVILAKAFRGELVEPDPNDEPAEELLKRVLAEKAEVEGVKKSK